MHVILKTVSIYLTVIFFVAAGPAQSAVATMIGTDRFLEQPDQQVTRDRLILILGRQEVQERLVSMGLNPLEAMACVNSLSEEEINRFADQIKDLPAGGGGGAWGFVGIAVIVTFVVLLITDLLGYTDFFNIR
jgi:hypothetical protein